MALRWDNTMTGDICKSPENSASFNHSAPLTPRHELAACFFILAGQHWDAVGVLAHERGDPQLALLVARLLEGGATGPCTQRLMEQVSVCGGGQVHSQIEELAATSYLVEIFDLYSPVRTPLNFCLLICCCPISSTSTLTGPAATGSALC